MIPLPEKTKIVSEGTDSAVFEIEGLFPGYGQTLGNSLRRVLLSSLSGAAITSIKINGVNHEFSAMEGVAEDVVEIMLNLKLVRFRLYESGPFTITLSEKGEKTVTAGDFQTPSQVEVINKDAVIAALTSKKIVFSLEAVVESGLGYVPVEEQTKEKMDIGMVALDAAFSPVRHVNYEVENMRVGDRTDYNRLRLHVQTDGTLTPHEAFEQSVDILIKQFHALVGFNQDTHAEEDRSGESVHSEDYAEDSVSEEGEEKDEVVLKTKIDELKLSSRTMNVLREAGIKTIGGLTRKREDTIRDIGGLGEKGMQEIKKALSSMDLSLKQ